jgi:hypothetical protein
MSASGVVRKFALARSSDKVPDKEAGKRTTLRGPVGVKANSL